MRRLVAVMSLVVMVPLLVIPAAGQTSDTVLIVKEGQVPTNAEIAVTVAQETFTTASRVIVARDDAFADALASGVLQAGAPLLLVPSAGPIPGEVTAEIADLAASEAVVLGGEQAVSADVAGALSSMGLAVSRRQGASRFETAIDIAATDAPAADTVMLARAFGANPADPSQGFADSIAAGGISARTGFPVLLTETARLSSPTRAYLDATTVIGRVLILGGTAAVSQAVEDELRALGYVVERIAGASRAETAIEVAKVAGDQTAADAARVVVADGTGDNAWAAGFALASHAAQFDAPIVLTTGEVIPPATEAFLEPGIGGDPSVAPVLTCAAVPSVCEPVRVAAQLPPAPQPSGTRSTTDTPSMALTLGPDEVSEQVVQLSAGDTVSLGYRDLVAADPAQPTCIDLDLLDPAGDVLSSLSGRTTQCSDSEATDGAVGSTVIEVDGPHVLRTTFFDGQAGSVTVFLNGTEQTTTTPDGPAVPVELSRPGDVHAAAFQGQAGQLVSFGYRNLVAADPTRPACIDLDLIGPALDELESLSGRTSQCSDREQVDGLIGTVELPTSGTYLLQTAFWDGGAGSVEVLLNDPELVDVTPDGDPLDVSLDRPGDIHAATFSGRAGDQVSIGYDRLVATDPSQPTCVDLDLFSPTMVELTSLSGSTSQCSDDEQTDGERGITILPVDGTYTLQTAFYDGRGGSIRVFLNAVEEVAIQPDGPPTPVTISRPGGIQNATFMGQAGDLLSIGYDQLTAAGAGQVACIDLDLFTPTFDELTTLSGSVSQCSDDEVVDGQTGVAVLPVSGEYTLQTAFFDGALGTVRAYLNAPTTGPITVGGAAVPVTLSRPGDTQRATFSGTAGQQVTIGYSGLTAADPAAVTCIDLDLLAPDGSTTSTISSSVNQCSDDEVADEATAVTLPVTGVYALEAAFHNGATGSVSMRVS